MWIFERWYFGLCWNSRLVIIELWYVEGFWIILVDFFEDYIFAWWNIWVFIDLLLHLDTFKCKATVWHTPRWNKACAQGSTLREPLFWERQGAPSLVLYIDSLPISLCVTLDFNRVCTAGLVAPAPFSRARLWSWRPHHVLQQLESSCVSSVVFPCVIDSICRAYKFWQTS
jgi:hypothetical protein